MGAFSKILLLFLPLISFSQAYDSIEEEIINARPSQHELVFKARFLLIEALENSNQRAIQKYSTYLVRIHETNRNSDLSVDELMLLCFINSDYRYILHNIQTSPLASSSLKYHLTTELRTSLIAYSEVHSSYILSKIFLSNLKEDEKHFLKLYFNHVLAQNDNIHGKSRLMENMSAKEFVEKFPESPYVDYVRNFILLEKVVKDFQWGINLGCGYGFYSGDISRKLDQGFNVMLGFEFFYKKWMLNLKLQSLSSSAVDSIRGVDLTLSPGQVADYLDFHFSAGYDLFKGKNMSLTPYLGLGFSRLARKKDNKNDDLPIVYNFSPAINAGIQYNYYFGEIFSNRAFEWNYNPWMWGINVRYHMTSLIGFDTKGLIHGLTIGFLLKSNYKRRVNFRT